jgi:hypothetical protein
LHPASCDTTRLEGDYALYDDGWRCALSLRRYKKGGGVEARFFSYDRVGGAFDAVVSLDPDVPYRLQLMVSNFNEALA